MAIFGSGTPISKVVTGGFPVFVASFARMLLAAAVISVAACANPSEPQVARSGGTGLVSAEPPGARCRWRESRHAVILP